MQGAKFLGNIYRMFGLKETTNSPHFTSYLDLYLYKGPNGFFFFLQFVGNQGLLQF